jgi:hypothetical protein
MCGKHVFSFLCNALPVRETNILVSYTGELPLYFYFCETKHHCIPSVDISRKLLKTRIFVSRTGSALHKNENTCFPHVHSFQETLQCRFRTIYTPDQHIAIDEGMVLWKGRLSFRQYIPNKPDIFGIKLYQRPRTTL